ncbi:MAG: alkaline phosphatase family protein [Crocinitomicaceae bacterium]|nr:alkaline phosphatase family protein [Crocinitomicaceae bacterium]
MKPHFCIFVILFSFPLFGQQTRIAFGSCAHQDDSLLIFNRVVSHKPDYFVFLGDNIYGDTQDMDTLQAKYDKLASKPTFQALKQSTKIMATWDDHDFGWNDVGCHYDCKRDSKDIFLKFFEEPTTSSRWDREGIYTSYMYAEHGKTIQFILLDERTFRSDLPLVKEEDMGQLNTDGRFFYFLDYNLSTHPDSTMLGEEQWLWLEKELMKKADVRIICSGTQFGISYNGYEAWANFPLEQERMLALIRKTRAEGVLFISGDVHYAEISRLKVPDTYPIYDVTSSGLSENWKFAAPNTNRIEGPVMDHNFGLITLNWASEIPLIKMEIWDKTDNQRLEYTIPLTELKF